MKIQKIIFALVIATFTFIGCEQEVKKEELAISISGMTCEIGCAKLIESKLNKQEGVLDAKVVFNDSIATIKYDGSKTNKASLISFVEGIAGNLYTAKETKVKEACAADCKKEDCAAKEKKTSKEYCESDCCKDEQAKACTTDLKAECCADKKA